MMRRALILCTIVLVTSIAQAASPEQRSNRLPGDQSEILMMQARAIFGPLPSLMPGSEHDTPAQVALGKMLYFEPGLSINRRQSCGTCHPLEGNAGGMDNLSSSPGALGALGLRNAPTTLNAGFQISQFWDGRAPNLAEQAKGPILNASEMGMPHVDACLTRMRQSDPIVQAFGAAFPGQAEPITYDNLAQAIAAFERTLISRGRFDRYMDGDPDALTAREKVGLGLFMNEGCIRCHSGPLLGGMLYQRVGIYSPYRNTSDLGRFIVTKKESDRYVFKAPSLRNVTLTAPYFHDGKVATLPEAVDEMARMELDRKLTSVEIDSILRFLTSLADFERTSAAVKPMKKSLAWNPPAWETIPKNEEGDLIRYGYQLLMRTPAYLGKGAKARDLVYSGGDLACGNCHQEGGTKIYGIPWMGVIERYPQYSSRSKSDVTLDDRVNDCMERSMNGRSMPKDRREMKAMVAYMTWLSKDLPKDRVGLLKVDVAVPDRRADLERGNRIYREYCQACHAADGAGYRARSSEKEGVFVTPTVWGAGSFNSGAGMHRLLMTAAFIKGNMPLGTPWDRPVLSDEQAYDVAAYINSLERPKHPNTDKDWPDLAKKPIDCPYPPYNDGFTQDQHKYGPYGPIRDAGKKSAK